MALQMVYKLSHKKVKRMNDIPLNLRVTKDLKNLLKTASSAEEMSLSLWARRTLRREAEKVIKSLKQMYSNKQHNVNEEKTL